MIYLDWSSTTPICEVAKQEIIKHLDDFGNPSSSYEFARKSRLLIEDARERIAKCINAKPDEIYFTSGGSEANTWALDNFRIISSSIEHHSIKSTIPDDNIKIDHNGIIRMQDVNNVDNWYYRLVSCMHVNNEIGTIQPIKEISQVVHQNGMLFHTDAVQAVGHIPIDVKNLDCDMLSASGHKFGALKGIGFLYIKNNIEIRPLIYGGKQESGLRGGTENILGIISMATALEDSVIHMEERNRYIQHLRDELLNELLQIPCTHLNGSLENRVVSNINIRFDGVSGSRLVALCDLYGICISSGSACNEGNAKPSHVLEAIGLTDEEALNSVRITIGHQNTEEEIVQAAKIITKLVERIRNEET